MPTKTELKQHAKELKIKGFSKMNKEHLESAIYLKSVCTWYDSLTEGNTDKVNDRSDRDFGSLQDVAWNSLCIIYNEISGNSEIGQQE